MHASAGDARYSMTMQIGVRRRAKVGGADRTPSLFHALIAIAAVASVFPFGNARGADLPRIHVRGTSRIDAHAARAAGKLVLSGTLVDDAARAAPGERIALTIAPKGDPAHAISLASGGIATACEGARGATAQPTLERADTIALKTDEGGRFCVRLGLARDRFVAHLAFGGAGNVDATQVDVPVDLSLKPLTMRFDPVPHVLALDGPPPVIEVVATIDDEGTTTPGADLPLTLTNESGASLGAGSTTTSGRVRFTVAQGTLGAAGRGELRVLFAGTSDTGSAVQVAPIERHAKVDLAVPAAPLGRLPPGSPEDGVAIDVAASARSDGAGAAPGGSVEARVGDVVVGAAPLEAGKARVLVTFATPSSSEMTLQLRYASDAPWYEPGSELAVVLPVRSPSPWRHAPVVVAGLAVLAWLVLGRARAPRRSTEKSPPSRRPAFRGEASVHVVPAAPGVQGFTGHVVDAHEGSPVDGARIAIVRPTFDTEQTLASATSDANGDFDLPAVDARDGDLLIVEGALYSPLRQPLPQSGDITIAVVLRKRALLDRLVAWARRRGRPFDAPPEPTPGHVRRAAGADFAVARWADAVERAAFGAGTVDAHVEADVERLKPDAMRASTPEAHDTVEDPSPPVKSD
jgi:hypothetical protein